MSKSIKTNIVQENLNYNLKKRNILINSASINSKKINKNSIFIGIKGKNMTEIYLQAKLLKTVQV